MDETQVSLRELLRRACAAQVELGVGEVILSRDRPPSPDSPFERSLNVIRKKPDAIDLFGVDSHQRGEPRFQSLEAHYREVCACQLCPLAQTRNRFVYGVGDPDADLLFVGEAPGRDEDLQGEPFVGRAGQLLDKILAAIGLTRGEVYIANILKCRPPENRDPLPSEVDQCLPHLQEQIRLIRPRLICALGRIAGQILLQTHDSLGRLRGRWHDFEGVPLMVTYHPAALLRAPMYKKDTWADMQDLRRKYDEIR